MYVEPRNFFCKKNISQDIGAKLWLLDDWLYSEVVHGNSEGVHDLCINSVILKINEIHLLPDLEGGGGGGGGAR